jgi:integrase
MWLQLLTQEAVPMARRRQNGEGSIYQRASDGLWVGSVTLDWDGNKRVRKTVAAKTATEVREKLRQVRTKVDAGLPVGDDKLTVNQLLDRWFKDVMRHQVASPALSNYEAIAKGHIRPTLGRKQVSKLKPAEIDALLSAKLDSGLSVSTVRRIRSVLAQAITQAQRWEMVGRNAASLSRPPRAPRREGRSLSPEQIQKLIAEMTDDRLAGLFLTMLGTGLRRGEALALRWADVDLKRAVLTVRDQLRREPGRIDPETGIRVGAALVLVKPKTASSKRSVPLSDWVVDVLKVHKARQAAERLALGEAWRDSGFVFTTTIGTPVDPRNASRAFSDLAKKAGLGAWHIHELRHSAASTSLAQGVPVEVVSAFLGHSSIRMTVDTYGHIGDAQLRSAADAMDVALGGLVAAGSRPPAASIKTSTKTS